MGKSRGQKLQEQQLAQLQQFSDLMRQIGLQREQQFQPFAQQLQQLTGPLEVAAPTGFTPEERAALTAQAIEQVPERFAGAASQLKLAAARRGALSGGMPASGQFLAGLSGLLGQQEQFRTGLLRQNILQEQALKEQQLEAARRFALSQRQQQLGAVGAGLEAFDPSRVFGQIPTTFGPATQLAVFRPRSRFGAIAGGLAGAGLGALTGGLGGLGVFGGQGGFLKGAGGFFRGG